VSGPGQRSRG